MDKRFEQLEKLTTSWEGAGLDPEPLASVRDALARYASIGPEAAAIRADESNVLPEVARRIATGELTFAEGIKEHLLVSAPYNVASGGSSQKRGYILQTVAENATLELAVQMLRDRAGDLVDILDDAREVLVSELEKIAPALADEEDTGSKAVKARARLSALEQMRAGLARGWAVLNELGIVNDRRPEFESPSTMHLVRSINERSAVAV